MSIRLSCLAVSVFAFVLTSAASWANGGSVVDTNGTPVPHAKVRAFQGDMQHSKKIPLYTDSNGHFTFTPSVPGRYYYLAEADGYGYAMACERREGKAEVTIKLWPEGQVRGQVVDVAGKPIAGATVSIHAFEAWDDAADQEKGGKPWIWFRDQPAFAGSVQTDDDGWFTIGHIPDPSVFQTVKLRLDAHAKGRAPATKMFYKSDLKWNVKLVCYRACTLTGRVLLPDKSGPAPETIGVTVEYDYGEYDHYRAAYLDENGCFSFTDIPQGLVTVNLGSNERVFDEGTDQPMFGPLEYWIQPKEIKVMLLPNKLKHIDIVLEEPQGQ